MTCERCWDDAYLRSRATPESQAEAYEYLIAVRDQTPAERRKCEAYNAGRRKGDA